MSYAGVMGGGPAPLQGGIISAVSLSLVIHFLIWVFLTQLPNPSSDFPLQVSDPVLWVSLKLPEDRPLALSAPPVLNIKASPLPLPSPSPVLNPSEKIRVPPPLHPPPLSDLSDVSPVSATPPAEATPDLTNRVSPIPSPPFPMDKPEGGNGEMTASIQAVSVNEGGSVSYGPLLNYPYYFEGIQRKVSALWVVPTDVVLLPKEDIRVVVGFIVQKNGKIREKSVAIEKSSGNSFWDSSALRAVYNADPLLPLPKGITEEIHVHFEFTWLHS